MSFLEKDIENDLDFQNSLFTEIKTIPQHTQKEEIFFDINIYNADSKTLQKVSTGLISILKSKRPVQRKGKINIAKIIIIYKRKIADKNENTRKNLIIFRKVDKYNYFFQFSSNYFERLGLKKYMKIFSELIISDDEDENPLINDYNQIIEKEHTPFIEQIEDFCGHLIYENNFENFCSIMLEEQEIKLIEEKQKDGLLGEYINEPIPEAENIPSIQIVLSDILGEKNE